MNATKYQRLTRARARSAFAIAFMSRASLWLGEDHLLAVESNGYSETYKRFYFRDIQTFTIQKNPSAAGINLLLAILTIFPLAIAVPAHDPVVKAFAFIIAGVFGFLLLINFFLGANCKCYLRTAVQIEELPSLARIGRTRKILQRLRPIIAAAQGETLTPQTIATLMQQSAPKSDGNSSGTPPVLS